MSRARSGAPEFSRPLPLARLGMQPFRQEIAATEAERVALARRFDLVALDRLSAVVELVREGSERILLRAGFEAEFAQSCIITLDPVVGTVAGRFGLLYGPPEAEDAAGGIDGDIAFEPLAGDTIDLGEAVAQEFSLALPPFPRSPGASVEDQMPLTEDTGPLAALARLLDRPGDAG